jgi:hypothetical protein
MKRFVILLAACGGGDGETKPSIDAPPQMIDAAIDAPPGGFTTCTGACRTTSLTATFAVTRVLDRAYYGVTASPPSLHVEAYRNAPAGCPTMSSPSPDYTLVLGTVPIPTSTTPSTSPGNILDFEGDLLGGPLGAAATSVMIAPVAADRPMDAAGFVALDVMITFANGTASGHLFATHCASLDSPN